MLVNQHAALRRWDHRIDELRSQAFEIYQQVREAQRGAAADTDECLEHLYTAADAAFELACQLIILVGDASGAVEDRGVPAVVH